MQIKLLLLAFLFVFTPVVVAAQTEDSVEQSYDRFQDTTTLKARISLYPPRGVNTVLWVVAVTSKGQSISARPNAVGILLHSASETWVYGAGDHEWLLILNGSERIALGTAKRLHANVGRGYVTEGLIIPQVPLSIIEKIAKADKLEMRVGRTEFELSSEQLKPLREFLSRLPEK